MKKKIGNTFGAELEAAGLAGLPFSWGEDGEIQFSEEITKQQHSKILAVYDMHDSTKQLVIKTLTPVEKLTIFLTENPDVASLISST